jgi:hypothetical protein
MYSRNSTSGYAIHGFCDLSSLMPSLCLEIAPTMLALADADDRMIAATGERLC